MRVQVLLLRHPARHKELPLLQVRDPDTEEDDNRGGAIEPADFDFVDGIANCSGPEGLVREIDLSFMTRDFIFRCKIQLDHPVNKNKLP